MKPHRISISVGMIAIGLAAFASTAALAKEDFNIKYFGKCGALYDGDKLVTRYSGKSGKTTGYAIGKGCKDSHPDAASVGFSTFDTMRIEGFFVRGMKTNKEGVTRKTIIRKEGARYIVRSSVVK